MRILKSLCILLLMAFSSSASSQSSLYSVIVAGRTVGSLRVYNYDLKNNMEMHRIESDFKFLFYKGKYSIQSSYSDGRLLTAVAAHYVNGDLKEKTQTKSMSNPLYQVLFSGEDAPKDGKRDLNFHISSTITGLYYKEPVNIKEVYSERFGQMCSVKKLSEGDYGVTLPDGKEGIYSYRNGRCREVKTDLAGFKLRIVLNDKKTEGE